MNPNSDVKLFFNNAEKLATSGIGVTVIGQLDATNIKATGITTALRLDVKNGSQESHFAVNQIQFNPTEHSYIDNATNNKDIYIRLSKSSTTDTTMMQINAASEQTKFHKYVNVGLQGGNDTAVLGGGSGIGAMLILNHATTGRNTFLAGNGDSYLNVNHGNLGIGTANPSGKVVISANASTNMLMFNNRDASSASNFARMGYNSAAGVEVLDIRCEGHIRFLTGGNNERLRFSSNGGVGINTDKIRNTKNVSIAGVTRDYTNSGTDLVDAGGIILQPTIHLPSTGQAYPGIYWSGNTAALGRARAGITGVAASNNDATDLVFLTKNSGGGHGLYPEDESMRLTNSGRLIIGHTSSPTSDSDRLQIISTSSGTGINLFNYSASAYGNQIGFMKSRSAAVGNTILQNGDRIGELNFYGNDGSGRSLGAQISVRLYGTPSNDNTPTAMYFKTGTNQSMETRLSILPSGNVGVSKNGWASSDNSFGLTVHTGSTSETGPVNDGIMIVSQQNNGNQNSSTGKLMFCGHAQTNGPFLYGDNSLSYGKKDLVFHTRSTANDYTTQLAETARFTYQGRFGLGTGVGAVDSLMHIQGNSDSGDEFCQLTIEDEDDTSGSQVPSIMFKGNGSQLCKIRATSDKPIRIYDKNNAERWLINDYGETISEESDHGWSTYEMHSKDGGTRFHYRRVATGSSGTQINLIRVRRHYWGSGNYKIKVRQTYYNGSYESHFWLNGHAANGANAFSLQHQGQNGGNSAWIQKTAASHSAPGNNYAGWTDVFMSLGAYEYYEIIIEASLMPDYSHNINSLNNDGYALHAF